MESVCNKGGRRKKGEIKREIKNENAHPTEAG
ncbi:hypothetical protein B23_3524 [Geobacillus thermoleovorans B23]|nr:hypothetical protein B23_3524 [Geobacillus thermoleovorans B23]